MRTKSLGQTGALLVCTGSDCKKCGSKELCGALRACLKEAGLQRDVRVQKVRCLGCCGKAPNVLSIPTGVLYSDVSTKDAEKIARSVK
ncbi:MAG: (2Fe-2S) ferredoxin domain-containing protein [Candidatus Hydrogenedentes bacterium]|nr:(2Fe-2S) ferredoxin domain-containing protein [Candidatus Hydrogenedentota bacterium]